MSSTNVTSGLDVAGDAEPAEHLLAEAVRGGDRRRVEVRERAREAVAAPLDLLARALGEQPHDRSSRVGRRARPSARASPCSALTSRSRTRSRSSPVAIRVNVTSSSCSSGVALGDVARRERGDRVRLAGARARLEHGHAGRQRAADVERRVLIGPPPARSRAGRPTGAARSRPKRVGSLRLAVLARRAAAARAARRR